MTSYTQVNNYNGHNYSLFNFDYGSQGYSLYSNKNDIEITYGNESVYLDNYDRLQFSDLTIASKDDYIAGQAYRVYKAAFDREPDLGGLGYWIDQMDHGLSLQDVSNGFIDSVEFNSSYGSVNDRNFIELLYQNVLDRAPDFSGYDYWITLMENGSIDRAGVLAEFSESAENISNTSAYTNAGVIYTPVTMISNALGYQVYFDNEEPPMNFEYGDYYWNAHSISNNESLTGDVGYGTDIADHFEFTADFDGTVTIALSGLSDDIDLFLYDEGGYEIGFSSLGGVQPESITIDQQAGTTYIVGVKPFYDASSSYNLTLSSSLLERVPTAGDSVLHLELMDLSDSGPLGNDNAIGFSFELGGYYYNIQDNAIEAASNYGELKTAIETALYMNAPSLIDDVVVELGDYFYVTNADTGERAFGNSVDLISLNGADFDAGSFTLNDYYSADYYVSYNMSVGVY